MACIIIQLSKALGQNVNISSVDCLVQCGAAPITGLVKIHFVSDEFLEND